MAGPQDIQRYPRGLIDVLGLRSTGDTPSALSMEQSAVLDMWDLYLADRCEAVTFNASGNVTALGNLLFTGATVPQGEMWLLYELTIFSGVVAAATSQTIVPWLSRSQTGTGVNVSALADPCIVGIAGSGMTGRHFERPTVCMPGQTFGLQVVAIVGAPANLPILNLYFARIKV